MKRKWHNYSTHQPEGRKCHMSVVLLGTVCKNNLVVIGRQSQSRPEGKLRFKTSFDDTKDHYNFLNF